MRIIYLKAPIFIINIKSLVLISLYVTMCVSVFTLMFISSMHCIVEGNGVVTVIRSIDAFICDKYKLSNVYK